MDVKNEEGKKEKLPLYLDGESVSGKVRVAKRIVGVVKWVWGVAC